MNLLLFRQECKYGPIFTCICCKRDLFQRGVRILEKNGNLDMNLKGSGMFRKYLHPKYPPFDEDIPLSEVEESMKKYRSLYFKSLEVNEKLHLCHTCIRYLEKMEMPPICWKNSLDYMDTPECLQITNIEKQLIAKSLVFIKVRQLPVSRMDSMNDRVINVAIEDDDIIKEVTSLPRTEKNSGMITVGMKRKLDLKNYHKFGMIRPDKIYDALVYLKKNHPEYKNIDITQMDDWIKEYHSQDNDVTDEESGANASESSDESESDENQSENFFTSSTCLLPEEPLNDVIGKFEIDHSIAYQYVGLH